MNLIDYNGEGRWSREAILTRYARYAAELGIVRRDLSPHEHKEGGRHWVYPVMQKVIEGINADDPACVRLGIEFIEEDGKFRFGKILKSNTARASARVALGRALRTHPPAHVRHAAGRARPARVSRIREAREKDRFRRRRFGRRVRYESACCAISVVPPGRTTARQLTKRCNRPALRPA